MALESADGSIVPTNARILRNLVLGPNFLQSHILHFYLLASLDYVTGPAGVPWNPCWNVDLMRSSTLQQIADHFTRAVAMRRQAHEMAAVFAGRMPGLSALQAGGFTFTWPPGQRRPRSSSSVWSLTGSTGVRNRHP